MLEPEIAALRDGAVDHLGVFVEPSLVLVRTSRIDHDVARAADPLFGAEAELHLALEHPTICSFACRSRFAEEGISEARRKSFVRSTGCTKRSP